MCLDALYMLKASNLCMFSGVYFVLLFLHNNGVISYCTLPIVHLVCFDMPGHVCNAWANAVACVMCLLHFLVQFSTGYGLL